MMKKKVKKSHEVQLNGQLKFYIQLPVYMATMLITISIGCFVADTKSGAIMLTLSLVFALMVGFLHYFNRSLVLTDIMEFASTYGDVQNTILKELKVPYAILMEDGRIVWMNHQFEKVIHESNDGESFIHKYIPLLTKDQFPKYENDVIQKEIKYDEKD